MNSRHFVLGGLLALWASSALGGTCPTSNVIDDPEQFQWEWAGDHFAGTMEIGEATFTIGTDTITTRAYRQEGGNFSIPGPTMNLIPGEKYVLRFANRLPYEAPNPDHNVFKDPNISNLHTHGLHISGESPGDDVTRSFEGGRGGDFVYDIPADHMGGTFWYHAHHHGSTFLQVSGGAFGLMVVDDSQDGIPVHVASMQERQLVVAYLDPDVAGTGGDTLITGTLSPSWTVNGKIGGSMCMPADSWQHWRVLVADRDARSKTVTVGEGCEVALLARDGVWRTQAPLALPARSINLTGASRADLAVRCAADSTISIGNQVVANVIADPSLPADPDSHPFADASNPGSTWEATRPAYLRDLRGVSQVNRETVSMGARTINGQKFDAEVPTFVLNDAVVQEWTVKGATQHPFHLHIYHMQMVSDCGDYEGGEYYDVIATNCDVRFDLNPATAPPVYEGRTIMHCHILAHEDQGAMGWANVAIQNSVPPPEFPAGSAYSEYYVLDGGGGGAPSAPTSLNASAVSSSQIDLAWVDNATDEDGFSLERSTDGTNWSVIASLGQDFEAYSDLSLAASATYFYRVNAFNAAGSSDYSNTSSATTQSGGGTGTALVVSSITVSTVNQGRGSKAGQAVVVVQDNQGNAQWGATVTGYFTGTFNEFGKTASTNASGAATFNTDGSAKGGVSVTFCVNGVQGSLPYSGGEVCGSL